MQTHVIKKIRTLQDDEKHFFPVEMMVKNMNSLEQYAERVVSYTSKYNISFSISYAPENLVGKYVKYPSYGDFAETYILRSYGKWWKESEAYQQEYMPQDMDPLGAEDYVTLGFEYAVVPRDVCIYETYNPGAVVRIWGRFSHHSSCRDWQLLWEGPPQICPEESRKFHPKIRKLNCLINEIRLEFNQSHLKYHTSIDAVLLGGFESQCLLQQQILQNDLLKWELESDNRVEEKQGGSTDYCDFFSWLPHEVVLQIFQNLDLKSLSMCAQVNKQWNEATKDPILYQNLSLKRYWHRMNGVNLHYFTSRCKGVKKLDLSWCGNEDVTKQFCITFIQFLHKCCQHLTHLSLCHCEFVNNNVLAKIVMCQDLTELRLRGVKADFIAFKDLARFKKLVTLDLCSTNVTDGDLIGILKSNRGLKHIILDFCEGLEHLDEVVESAANFNKNLTTWSSFKTTTLTSSGGLHFAKCTNLKELDLGWCFLFGHPGDCLEKIAANCTQLKRLIISQWRGVNDQMLSSLVKHCKNLTQIDLLGIKSITGDICEKMLLSLPNLRLLDISFCDSILNEQVAMWRQAFPHVTIQRSCQYVVMDYLN